MGVQLTDEECRAIHRLIDVLSGGNPESVFNWDGDDSPEDPTDSACAKIYHAAGEKIPEELRGCVEAK